MPGQFHSLGEMIQSYENTGNSHFLSAEEREQVISLINQMKTQGSKSEKEEYSGFLQAYENRNYGSFESMPLLLKDFLSSEQMDLADDGEGHVLISAGQFPEDRGQWRKKRI